MKIGEMEHSVQVLAGGVVVILRGEVDLRNSPRARKLLLDHVARSERVVVDLSGVSYLDSSGLASLVEALQAARRRQGRLSLAAVSEAAERVLHLARLDKVFALYPSVAEALNAA